MSYSSEPLIHAHPAVTPKEFSHETVKAEDSHESLREPSNEPVETSTPPSKRSDVFRHVFPRPRNASLTEKSTTRIAKPTYRRNPPSASGQSKRRVALQKVITSLFHNSPTRVLSQTVDHTTISGPSSVRSRTNSGSRYGSLPSLDLVSPGTFLFSGPSLRSRSDSLSTSMSRLPSSIENGSDRYSLRRVHSDSFSTDNISLLEDGILEPYVEHGIVRSMSDVMLGVSTATEEWEAQVLEDVEEDVQSLSETASLQTQAKGSGLDAALAPILLPHLDSLTQRSLRLACRSWHSAIDYIASLKFTASFRAPNEILQQIYRCLGPKDFNAARHTCRNWMRASLDSNLLVVMLERGGWWCGVEADLERRAQQISQNPSAKCISEEWFLSRRLSRECALSSGWSGNGLGSGRGLKIITEVSNIDFTDLANGHPGSEEKYSGGLTFTTSVCGQFLIVARDTLIYIYDIRDSNLMPVTSVVCPRKVLSMSMDVSSGRNAVAALLEGRMGLVCELLYGRKPEDEGPTEVHVDSDGHLYRSIAKTSILTSRESDFEAGVDAADRTLRRDYAPSRTPFESVNVQSNYEAVSLHEVNNHRSYIQNHINPTWNLSLRGPREGPTSSINSQSPHACHGNILVENGTSTFYRHLCSEDDPPRSVSICPQRRCVAFGCSAGIELHWIDALTGQSLSRWFPLTAPSDYLYFLAPRPGFESAKKLRLISSAAHPDDRPALSHRLFGRPTANFFWGSFGFESSTRRSGSPGCDHYHAVPLSDGHHILFIEPQTSRLFMGCDAPLGGPTKLLRKIMFMPPPYSDQAPRVYGSAFDMSWGARIVVAFGDTIVLYSVSPEVCKLSREEQKAESWDVYTSPPFSSEGRSPNHWVDWWAEPYPSNRWGSNPIWPIAIWGTEIGTLRNVCELTVHTKPDITIWGFTSDSQCKIWQLRNHADPVVRSRRYVCSNGLVHDACKVDETRDVIMADIMSAPSSPPSPPLSPPLSEFESEHSIGFDGHSSQVLLEMKHISQGLIKRIPRALSVENDEWVDFVDVRGCDAWYESNGDVVMVPRDVYSMD